MPLAHALVADRRDERQLLAELLDLVLERLADAQRRAQVAVSSFSKILVTLMFSRRSSPTSFSRDSRSITDIGPLGSGTSSC